MRMSINPCIPGFAPDPACIRVNDTYYLVNSAFQWFPNLPIYTSKDLLTWTHTTNAINRPEQLSFAHSFTRVSPPGQWGECMMASGGLYAPTIRYHEGLFYVVCTNVIQKEQDGKTDQRQNFIVTSQDPFSDQWSDPTFFDFDGIDVSPFWDESGKSYIVGSAVPGPMTTVKLFEIDLRTGKKLSDEKLIWRGTGGVYPEGPHIYVKDGWHYLIISEGGCFEDHMITAARSKNLWGPYEPFENNPLITARNTTEYIRHIGHSDMFTDPAGNWWLVCLGVRKDPNSRYLMGRETFLTPMLWEQNDWPKITQPTMTPNLPPSHHLPTFTTKPSITAPRPELEYIHLRDPDLSAYTLSNNTITMQPSTTTASADGDDITSALPTANPTFLAKRIHSLDNGIASVTLHLPASPTTARNLKAGVALYKDEHRFARIFFSTSDRKMHFELRNAGRSILRSAEAADAVAEGTRKLALRVQYSEENIELSYRDAEGEGEWVGLGGVIDSLELTGLDFTGPVIGIFASVSGKDGKEKKQQAEDGSAGKGDRAAVMFEGFDVQ